MPTNAAHNRPQPPTTAHLRLQAFNTNVPHVLAESDYSHRVQELTIGINFMSNAMGTNVGGPALKLGTLNALITATDPSVGVRQLRHYFWVIFPVFPSSIPPHTRRVFAVLYSILDSTRLYVPVAYMHACWWVLVIRCDD